MTPTKRQCTIWKRVRAVVFTVAFVALFIGSIDHWALRWSRFNCWTNEINITTGHTRYTRYRIWVITERRVDSTWVSDALGTREAGSLSEDWRITHILSPRDRWSPNFTFRAAPRTISQTATVLNHAGAEPTARQILAESVVWLWRYFDDAYEASQYLDDAILLRRTDSPYSIDEVPALEDWLTGYRARIASEQPAPEYLEVIDRAIASLPPRPFP